MGRFKADKLTFLQVPLILRVAQRKFVGIQGQKTDAVIAGNRRERITGFQKGIHLPLQGFQGINTGAADTNDDMAAVLRL